MPNTTEPTSLPPERAIERLAEGNRRFREGGSAPRVFRPELASASQRPFAVVLGCSDSRTPVEILFDQGFGELFVVRVAGNIVAPSIVGSIEFAVSQFGTRLVVVLGHTRCGAVTAAVNALRTGLGSESKNVRSILDRIVPHIRELVRPGGDEALLRAAVRANVRASVDHIRAGSRLLEDLVLAGHVAVIGAEYELETGAVRFLDRLPDPP
jgi:carbonic anhydrase